LNFVVGRITFVQTAENFQSSVVLAMFPVQSAIVCNFKKENVQKPWDELASFAVRKTMCGTYNVGILGVLIHQQSR
jgi:hypothetical protein